MSEWKSVPYGFGWAKEGDTSTYIAENMREDMEDTITALSSRIEELEREKAELAQRTWDNDAVSKRIDEAQRAAYEKVLQTLQKEVERHQLTWRHSYSIVLREAISAIKQEMEKGGVE